MINRVQTHFRHFYSDYGKTDHIIKVFDKNLFVMYRGISGTLLASQTDGVCDQ